MFKDADWFWKVSLGALALCAIPAGIGYPFVVGYCVETVRSCRTDELTLPEWTNPVRLLKHGIRVGSALALYSLVVCLVLAAVSRHADLLTVLTAVILVHTFVGPFVMLRYLSDGSFRSCFDLRSAFAIVKSNGYRATEITGLSFGVFLVVLCFGWMALIIGWPFFIFWGMLVSASFTAMLASSRELIEAPAP